LDLSSSRLKGSEFAFEVVGEQRKIQFREPPTKTCQISPPNSLRLE
jgi:hypothetical protein